MIQKNANRTTAPTRPKWAADDLLDTTKLVIVYARVSGKQQVKNYSLGEQSDIGTNHALWLGYEADQIVVMPEPGITGEMLDRPVMSRVRSLIREGKVAALVVTTLDRLTRDVSDQNVLAKECRRFGVRLIAAKDSTVSFDTAMDRGAQNLKGVFSQLERELIVERCATGRDAARRAGRWTAGKPPMGYSLIDKLLVPNDDATRVRLLFDMRADGKPLLACATASGLHPATARRVLKSRVYVGEVPAAGDWCPGLHDPLVSHETWQRAQRWRVPHRTGRHPLSRHVLCGLCGQTFRGHPYLDTYGFRCCNRPNCGGQRIMRAEALEAAVLIALDELANNEPLRAAIAEQVQQVVNHSSPAKPTDDQDDLAREIGAVDQQRRTLLRAHLKGIVADDLYADEAAHLDARLAELRERHRAITVTAPEPESVDAGQILRTLASMDAATLWQRATDDERRKLVQGFAPYVTVFPRHLEVTTLGLPPVAVLREEVPTRGKAGETGRRSMDAMLATRTTDISRELLTVSGRDAATGRWCRGSGDRRRARCSPPSRPGPCAACAPRPG